MLLPAGDEIIVPDLANIVRIYAEKDSNNVTTGIWTIGPAIGGVSPNCMEGVRDYRPDDQGHLTIWAGVYHTLDSVARYQRICYIESGGRLEIINGPEFSSPKYRPLDEDELSFFTRKVTADLSRKEAAKMKIYSTHLGRKAMDLLDAIRYDLHL